MSYVKTINEDGVVRNGGISRFDYNTIYTDAGSVSVDYRADTKLYINKKIAEALA